MYQNTIYSIVPYHISYFFSFFSDPISPSPMSSQAQDLRLSKRFGLDGDGFRARERDRERTLRWISRQEAEAGLREEGVSSTSTLVLAPIGLREPELVEYLKELEVDVPWTLSKGYKGYAVIICHIIYI